MSRIDQRSSRSRAEMEVEILGERLLIRANEDLDFVSEVAEVVKLRLQEANRRLQGVKSKDRVLLLALLDLAEEYVKSKRRLVSQRSRISAKLAEARLAMDRAEGKNRSSASEA